MFPNLNPRDLKKMMKQLGMDMEEIPAKEVIIKLQDGKELKISDAKVTKMKVQGQETFQVVGNASESSEEVEISQADIDMVAGQTGASKEEAEQALKESNWDIAEAIIGLSKK